MEPTHVKSVVNRVRRLLREGPASWGREDVRDTLPVIRGYAQKAIPNFSPENFKNGKNAPIQILDFFSGAGGTSLGFAALNSLFPVFKILGGCDINKISAETYSANYHTPVLNYDIRRLADDEVLLREFLKKSGYDSEKTTVIIGCAPCQGFSSHRKKHWNVQDDVRNSLVWAFAKIIDKLQPEVILMENVPEFLSNKYWRYFATARRSFQQNGYIVKQAIYNAAGFGVPQERFRAIVVAMKKNFVLPCPHLDVINYKTVRDAIGGLPQVSAGVAAPNDPLHKSAAHKKSTLDVIKAVPHDGGSRPTGIGPACLDKIAGFYDVYGRLFWDKPSITITHYARNPASGRFTHPEQDRGLTAREAALLQSFPNGFTFTGGMDDVFRQIGEAVPPMFAASVASHILLELISSPPNAMQERDSVEPIERPVQNSYSSVIAGIKNKSEEFTCIDAFCGAGGLALGLQKSGYKLLYSFDISKECIETIHRNRIYFSHKAEVLDISKALNGKLLKICKIKPRELFLLAGGPPCQGFSVQRRGNDEDERNNLVIKYLQLIGELLPKFFLMENVSGLGGKRGKTFLDILVSGATEKGYEVKVKLLDASDYGVPQRRKRYIIVGKRRDVRCEYHYPVPNNVKHTVRDTISFLPPPPDDGSEHPAFSLHRKDRLSAINMKRIKYLREGEGRDNLPPELKAKCHRVSSSKIGFGRVYGRMIWDDVAPTITARFDSFTRGQFGHPVQNRSITLREGALLQTFPIDYLFVGNKVEIARQIGNAVPPEFAELIGKSIIESYKHTD